MSDDEKSDASNDEMKLDDLTPENALGILATWAELWPDTLQDSLRDGGFKNAPSQEQVVEALSKQQTNSDDSIYMLEKEIRRLKGQLVEFQDAPKRRKTNLLEASDCSSCKRLQAVFSPLGCTSDHKLCQNCARSWCSVCTEDWCPLCASCVGCGGHMCKNSRLLPSSGTCANCHHFTE